MKKMRLIREIAPKVKNVKEVEKKDVRTGDVNKREEMFADEGVSGERISPSLERIGSVEGGGRFFVSGERKDGRKERKIYETRREEKEENRAKYETNTPREMVGDMGMASAAPVLATRERLIERESFLRSPTADSLMSESLDRRGVENPEREYKLNEQKDFKVKRRKELY